MVSYYKAAVHEYVDYNVLESPVVTSAHKYPACVKTGIIRSYKAFCRDMYNSKYQNFLTGSIFQYIIIIS